MNRISVRLLIAHLVTITLFMTLFFLPAGRIDYWPAWSYAAAVIIPMLLISLYLLNKNPSLLEKRMKFTEKSTEQRIIIIAGSILFVATYLLSGLDIRFSLSSVPVAALLISQILILISYSSLFFVFRANPYASRTISVEEGQRVIDRGPYSFIRHPMYAAASAIYILTPIALGSYSGLAAAIPLVILIAVRIVLEERTLSRELDGYNDYKSRVRYRVIPYIW